MNFFYEINVVKEENFYVSLHVITKISNNVFYDSQFL